MATSLALSMFERFNPAQLAGPLFDKELRVSSRRRRLYWMRFAYIGLLVLFVMQAYSTVAHLGGATSPIVRVSRMGQIGKSIIGTIAWFQFITGQILAVILLSGAVGGEVRQRTLDVLLTTPMTDWQIVMGKFSSKLLQVLTFLAISLPMLAVVRVFGGVPWDFVVSGLCITLTALMFVGALSLLLSVTSRKMQHVVGSVLAWCFILWVGLWGVLTALVYADYMRRTTSNLVIVLTNPIAAMIRATASMLSSGGGATLWPWHCLTMLIATAILLGLSVWRMRRMRWTSIFAGPRKHKVHSDDGVNSTAQTRGRLWPRRRRIRPVKGSPIVWREVQKGVLSVRQGSRWDRVRLVVVGVVILACVLLLIFAGHVSPGAIFMGLAFVLLLLFTLAVTSASASSIIEEKQARTWPILLATPLSNAEIVQGKALGSVKRHLPLLALAAVFGLVGLILDPRAVPVIGAAGAYIMMWLFRSAGTVVFLVGLASYFGVCLRSTTAAVVATFAIYLGARMIVGMVAVPLMMVGSPEVLVVLGFLQALGFAAVGFGVTTSASNRLRRKVFS